MAKRLMASRSISAERAVRRVENPDFGYGEARKEEILRAYEERSSLRGLARTFGVSRNTVTKWLKKSEDASAAQRYAGRTQ